MNLQLLPVTALLLLPCVAATQTNDEKIASGVAHARIVAARTASVVTTQACLADLSSWEAKDVADEKAKREAPEFWYEKLSTEELVRLSRESLSCGTVLKRAGHQYGASRMPLYGREFENELLWRAEAILADHFLMHEYLLRSTQ